ncbi:MULTISPECIES: NB-ARC domain-containing protein [Actinosynnema]|uniref:ATP-binding protein n=1 Tax=Actinosynnema TaxID=40566 RepID=UPI0020A599C2|nr:NB-ARC domain-containing protein [Actinosynnema pretiosum]
MENHLRGNTHGPVVQAGSIGTVSLLSDPPRAEPRPDRARRRPFELPPTTARFTGRAAELAELDALRLGHGPSVALLTGVGGIGKTALALKWLHTNRSSFPDGQLHVDLGAARTGSEVLESLLRSLGVREDDLPREASELRRLYLGLTARGAIALLLDDATSTEQVIPLLPASPEAAVLVTSRWRLDALAARGAVLVDVGPLDAPSALDLLAGAAGNRVVGEGEAARNLVSLCGGLPLALSVVAGRLAVRPNRSLSAELRSLRAAGLSMLSLPGGSSVMGVLDVSLAELPDALSALHLACAAHPGPEFGAEAAAAATGVAVAEAESSLAELVRRNLLVEVADGRYRCHDLLRDHALSRTPPGERDAALLRLCSWYLDLAVAADRAVIPARPRSGPRYAVVPPLADRVVALDLLSTERRNLVAVQGAAAERGWHGTVWQLAEALWGLFRYRHHRADWLRTHEVGVDAAARDGRPDAEARLRLQLAIGYQETGASARATAQVEAALELARVVGDRQITATALRQLGRIARPDDPAAALEHFRASLEVTTTLGQPRAEAFAHQRVGQALTDLGRHAEAVAELSEAHDIMAANGQDVELARVRCLLATPLLALGRRGQAADCLGLALPVLTTTGSPSYLGEALERLADLAHLDGDRAGALEHLRSAAANYRAVGEPVPAPLTHRLAELSRE